MIYIKSITLENFQTHKHTQIDFSPNFNVIVGPTRSGKSSAVRALDFLLYNNWYEDYQRFYSNSSIITAKLSDGKTIVREKSRKINKLTIISANGAEQRFESFGTSYPAEVIEAIGVTPVDIGTKDPILANVANQDDPLFLLYATGTDKTKALSRLSGLHWIDFALKDLNVDRHSNTKSIQLLKDTNVQLAEKLKYFQRLPTIRQQFEVEKARLQKLKQIDLMAQYGKQLVAKTSQWKVSYQEIQRLKQIDFAVEKNRLENIIRATEILQALKDLERKLMTNQYSTVNVQNLIKQSRDNRQSVESQIAVELSRIQICPACNQEILNAQEECHNS